MEGKLIIVSAPSGSGKTTIVKHLIKKFPQLSFSVSATNRPKREEETDGKDYYFLSTDEFKLRINNDEFVEWEEVYEGRFYGTLKKEIENIWEKGNHVIFDVDVVGGNNLKKKYGEKALSIFIKLPSIDILKQRLWNRATESKESFDARVAKVKHELEYEKNADVIVVNDQLSKALEESSNLVKKFLEI